MALFDASDWSSRILALFPKRWSSSDAKTSNLGILASIPQTTGISLAGVYNEVAYVKLQTRLLTTTDTNLDGKSSDYFGFGNFLRGYVEADPAFALRIQQRLIAPLPTIAGIQEIVSGVILAGAQAAILQPMALDEQGALDEFGSLDGGTLTNLAQGLPTITVFDYQSNPSLSVLVGLTPNAGQFAILFNFPNALSASNWFAGVSFAGVNTFAGSPSYQIMSSPSPGISAIVNAIKAAGTTPVYVSNIVS